jgi:hypothetical protein
VFGIVFLLTRSTGQNSQPNANVAQQPGLAPDPNSQPVQPAGTPTGEGERDVQAKPLMTPTPTPRNINANVRPADEVTPVVTGNFGANENANSSRNNNTNQRESSTPKPSPRRVEEVPPPPKPSPTVRTFTKPAASPAQ